MDRHVTSRRPLSAATPLLVALALAAPPALALAPACPSDRASLTTDELLAEPPADDASVVLEGIVTGVFMGDDQLGGFSCRTTSPTGQPGCSSMPRAKSRLRRVIGCAYRAALAITTAVPSSPASTASRPAETVGCPSR